MTDRVFNFAAGPATLPLPVLEQVQRDLVSLPGIGASPLEVSHRSPWFEDVIGEAEANLRSLLAIPDSHHVVFCQGGASMQFSMVPMNLLRGAGRAAAYVVTGSWGAKAVKEAEKEGSDRVVWSGKDEGFVRVPRDDELAAAMSDVRRTCTSRRTRRSTASSSDDAGRSADVPLISDSSSDFLSRPVDIAGHALLYAGAQKNAGPAGVTVAIVRDDLLARIPDGLPTVLDYRTYVTERLDVQHASRVRDLRADARDALAQGRGRRAGGAARAQPREGVAGLRRDRRQRRLLPRTCRARIAFADERHVAPAVRRPGAPLRREAAAAGLVELKGHRSVGGIRASLYNAMPLAGAQALADFMRTFAAADVTLPRRPPAGPRLPGEVKSDRRPPMGLVHDRPYHRNRSPLERG